jgi:hypothetical protein
VERVRTSFRNYTNIRVSLHDRGFLREEALKERVRKLPAELPAALFIVLHVPPQSPGLLPEIPMSW